MSKKHKNVESVVQFTLKSLTDTLTVKQLYKCHVIHTTLY